MEKHLFITGVSNISWKDAIIKAVEEVSKTINYLSNVSVLKQNARINGDKLVEYIVDLDISFLVDRDRKEDLLWKK